MLHGRADEVRGERRHGVRVVTALPLAHAGLGIAGVADVVEFRRSASGEEAYPVEYKLGRPKAHRADEVQLCAQALCLEDMLGQEIGEGALFYGRTRRRFLVTFDAGLRALTTETIEAVRSLIRTERTPSAEYEAARCDNCSLLELCQPKLLNRKSAAAWVKRQLELPPCADS